MKISLYLTAFFLAFLFETVVTAQVRFRRSPQRYCGSKLADVLRGLCNGQYVDPVTTQKPRKRSSTDITSNMWNHKDLAEDHDEAIPRDTHLMPPSSYMRISTKRTKGIVDECCNNPCHINELLAYCKPRV